MKHQGINKKADTTSDNPLLVCGITGQGRPLVKSIYKQPPPLTSDHSGHSTDTAHQEAVKGKQLVIASVNSKGETIISSVIDKTLPSPTYILAGVNAQGHIIYDSVYTFGK